MKFDPRFPRTQAPNEVDGVLRLTFKKGRVTRENQAGWFSHLRHGWVRCGVPANTAFTGDGLPRFGRARAIARALAGASLLA
jgi:hypothetical protein